MTGISAVIITRNEAHNIERCITSLSGVVDEVIVVDAESTDSTRELASALGARVVVRPWTNYADQKNFANDQAKSRYILSMDADEAFSADLKASLLTESSKRPYRCISLQSANELLRTMGTPRRMVPRCESALVREGRHEMGR